jgi:hypothetical protein
MYKIVRNEPLGVVAGYITSLPLTQVINLRSSVLMRNDSQDHTLEWTSCLCGPQSGPCPGHGQCLHLEAERENTPDGS